MEDGDKCLDKLVTARRSSEEREAGLVQEASGKREEGRHICVKNKRTETGDERWENVREVDDFKQL